jgi:hypothetical protein
MKHTKSVSEVRSERAASCAPERSGQAEAQLSIALPGHRCDAGCVFGVSGIQLHCFSSSAPRQVAGDEHVQAAEFAAPFFEAVALHASGESWSEDFQLWTCSMAKPDWAQR